ncbi:MAG: hypothetical protein K8E24_014255, partial [Methanobacterium paludis]|nr:hypothetical protein [Methanobacterium paludis]
MRLRLIPMALLGVSLFLSAAVGSQAAAKKHILLVTHCAGFRHTEGIDAGTKALDEMAAKTGIFTLG